MSRPALPRDASQVLNAKLRSVKSRERCLDKPGSSGYARGDIAFTDDVPVAAGAPAARGDRCVNHCWGLLKRRAHAQNRGMVHRHPITTPVLAQRQATDTALTRRGRRARAA
jgi:hypothetical protein